MKIAVYKGQKQIELQVAPMPECGDNDILIKNKYAAICGSDIHAYNLEGESVRIYKDSEFGHEMVSEVVAVGKNVKDISVGDTVYPYPMEARGRNRSCTVGGFSEYILIEGCVLNRHVYKVDPAISDKVASLIEPFTVGTRAARRATPQAGESAIVFGAGAIGAAAAIALKYFGCDKVMVVDFSDLRLAKLRDMGFEVCNSKSEDLKEKAIEVFGETFGVNGKAANVDIWIDAVGAKAVVDTCLALFKPFCRMVIVGVHHALVPMNLMTLTYSQASLIGSGAYFPEDVHDVMKIMSSKKFDIESFITHEYSQDDLCEAIETASDPDRSLKVVIRY